MRIKSVLLAVVFLVLVSAFWNARCRAQSAATGKDFPGAAQWIAAYPTDAEQGDEPLPLFRHSLSIRKPVRRATLRISGLGQYAARIDGRKIGDSELTPGWSDYRKTIYYDSYDLTRELQRGDHALGIALGNGMYRVRKTKGRYTKFASVYGPPQCIAQLTIEYADGSHQELLTDASWKTAPGPIVFTSIYGGEDYDARRDPSGWDRAGFNDSAWKPVLTVPSPGGQLRSELSAPIRVMKSYAPAAPRAIKPGVIVYDLGQNIAGWPEIEVSGQPGATLKIIPGELLKEDGTVSQRSSGSPAWFSYTLRGEGVERWHPRFSYYGFRYLQVEGATVAPDAVNPPVRLLALRGQAVHSSAPAVGSFESSDPLLNRIHALIQRAIENNSESIFTDCPHREKLGWLEETHLLASSLLYDYDFRSLFAATFQNIADAQRESGEKAGMVPEVAPQYVVFEPKYDVFNDSPEWGSAAVLAPWYVYQQTGDLSTLSSNYTVMKRYVDYLHSRAQNGIVSYGLGDWYDIGPAAPGVAQLTSPGVTSTAIYYQDLRVLASTAKLLGKTEDAEASEREAASVAAAFNARFFDASAHRYDHGSQTAQAMPLALGLVTAEERANVLDVLVSDIRAYQNHVTAGDIGFHYVVKALSETGRDDVLLDMLKRTDAPSYGDQLEKGATALTEAWEANPTSSQDHFMLGHAEEWFYRGLGGIDVDFTRKENERILLHPCALAGLGWVRTHYDSTLGRIDSNWKRGAAQTDYEFVVPTGATATLQIESGQPEAITINGKPANHAAGVLGSHIEGKAVRVVVGSGHYNVLARNPSQPGL
ncbi:family 78 glycoside hydrolase catalytic domain [Telmatobacter bradus]|uniref:family 78 glycoside hydrolase catalytic domain n=1 Tax=Telmatobacter bradus TaxID=474953 RepID=UPI003B428291